MAKRMNGEGSIRKRADGKWQCKIMDGYINGKPHLKYFYGTSQTIVKDKLKAYQQQEKIKDANKNTVEYFATQWLEQKKINELKSSSYDRLETVLKHQIIYYIGHYKLSELTDDIIQQQLINEIKGKYSYSTVKKVYNFINALCKYAVAKRILTHNPCDLVSVPQQKTFKGGKSEIKYLTEEQITLFKTAAMSKWSNGKPIYPHSDMFIFILNTGLRIGEALDLQWSDIDWENKTVKIDSNYVIVKNRNTKSANKMVGIVQNSTKTEKSNRLVNLNSMAIQSLNNTKALGYSSKKDLVFCNKDGEYLIPRNVDDTLKKIFIRANLEPLEVHSLRHTFASILFKRDVDVKTVSELFGHSDISITYNTYIHLIQEQKAKAVESIEDI